MKNSLSQIQLVILQFLIRLNTSLSLLPIFTCPVFFSIGLFEFIIYFWMSTLLVICVSDIFYNFEACHHFKNLSSNKILILTRSIVLRNPFLLFALEILFYFLLKFLFFTFRSLTHLNFF